MVWLMADRCKLIANVWQIDPLLTLAPGVGCLFKNIVWLHQVGVK